MSGFHCHLTPNDPSTGGMNDLVLHKQVLLKVFIFAWQLIPDWLPTKTNLVIRGMLHVEFAECGAGCGYDESASHLFLHCNSFSPLWGTSDRGLLLQGLNLMISVNIFFSSFIVHKEAQILPSASVVTLCLDGLE